MFDEVEMMLSTTGFANPHPLAIWVYRNRFFDERGDFVDDIPGEDGKENPEFNVD